MDKYIEFVLKRPVIVIVLLVLITLFMGMGMLKLEYDNSTGVMMPKGDNEYKYYEEVKKTYGNNGKFIIIDVTGKNIWSYDFFKQFDNLITDIEEYKNFNEDKEKGRLEKLREIIKRHDISYSSLIELFKGDEAFQRELARSRAKLFGKIEKLDKGKLNKLLHLIEGNYNLKKGSIVDKVICILTAKDISGANNTLRAVDIVNKGKGDKRLLPGSESGFQELKGRLEKNPAFEKALYKRDPKTGKITDFAVLIKLINIEKDGQISDKIWDIAKSYVFLNTTLQGIPIINTFMVKYMKDDLNKFLPFVLLVVLVVFFLNFRSFRGMLLPFISLVMGDVWIIGLMGHLGFKFTMMSVTIPSLMMAIGSSYAIHILNQYYIDYDDITVTGKQKGLKKTISHISITVVLAGITTSIGFISVLTSHVQAVSQWGLLTAIGVIFTAFITISFVPACFMLLPHKDRRKTGESSHGASWIDPVIRIFIKVSTVHYKLVLIVMGIILAVSVAGIFKMDVNTSVLGYFDKDDYIRKSSKLIGEKYGGFSGFSILINSGETDGTKSPGFLKTIDKFRAWLISEKNRDLRIGRTDAFPDIIKSMNMAMNNDKIEYYKIPHKRQDIVEYLEIYSGDDDDFDGRIDDFESYIDNDFRTALVFAKLHETRKHGVVLSTSINEHVKNRMAKYLDENLPKKYKYKISGEPVIMIQLARYVIEGQLQSLLLCFLVIGLIVMLLFKKGWAGFVALIPMAVAVIINFGIMGWFGIDLDPGKAIISAVTIGIGIDDTIHFLNTYRYFKAKDLTIAETIAKTLSISGKAISYTSLALIFGFSVLMLSNFMPIKFFGGLVALTMVATTIGALIVLPATIMATGVSLEESSARSSIWKYLDIGRFFNINKID
ncbi:RND family transporter [Spirochaetota bacterium]